MPGKALETEVIFEHASLGILLTRDRRIRRYNPRFAEMFGFGARDMEGAPTEILFLSHEDYQQFGMEVGGRLGAGESIRVERQFSRADGRQIRCVVTARAVDPGDGAEGTIWLADDVTEERRLEETHRRSEAALEAIMRNAPVGILFTANRLMTGCNEEFCRLFGFAAEGDVIGKPARILYSSDEAYAKLGQRVGPHLSRGESVSVELSMQRQNGDEFWAELVGYVVDAGDTGKGTIWLISDRSAARAQEQALKEALFENQVILDGALVGIAFLKNRIVQRCNAQLERILGYDPGTLAGRDTREWYLCDEDYNWVGEHVYPVIAKGKPHEREQRYRRQNGEVFWCRTAGQAIDPQDPLGGGSIWVMDDISARRAAEEALIGATSLIQAVFNSANVSIIATYPDGVIRLFNDTASRWLGYAASEMIDKQTPAILHDPEEVRRRADELSQELGETVAPGFDAFVAKSRIEGRDEHEWSYIRADGSRFPVHLSVATLRDFQGEISGYLGVALDLTDRKRFEEMSRLAQAQLEERVAQRTAELETANRLLQAEIRDRQAAQESMQRMAHYDGLTGLPNRNLLHDRLHLAMARARRGPSLLAVYFIDLDRFKNINDSLGHHVGDKLLQQVAARMSYVVRDTDTLARIGGDEFVLLASDLSEAVQAARVAEKLIEVLAQPIQIDVHELHISPSIGICFFPADAEDADGLLRNADTAMYHAKLSGRNTYQFFADSMNTEAEERYRIESALRHAVRNEELRLHYQPLQDHQGKVVGVEALLRWHSASLGFVPPTRFIGVAEESGLIVEIGEWVLREACRQIKLWREQGWGELCVAVNLSPRQFRQENLVSMVQEILAETALPSDALELEITESSLMHDVAAVIKTLTQLSADVGVRLAIDDFGTGYSSLAYLRHFPVHKLKIDRSFVVDMLNSEHAKGIVKTVIALADTLGLSALAEGVETEAEYRALQAMGCQYFQGYLFSKPLSPDDAAHGFLNMGRASGLAPKSP